MTSDQAFAAVGYLARSFSRFPLSADEQRPYLRLFAKLDPADVQAAIDALVLKSDFRPAPNEIAAEIRKRRPRPDTRSPEPLPEVDQTTVGKWIAWCKAQITQPRGAQQ